MKEGKKAEQEGLQEKTAEKKTPTSLSWHFTELSHSIFTTKLQGRQQSQF